MTLDEIKRLVVQGNPDAEPPADAVPPSQDAAVPVGEPEPVVDEALEARLRELRPFIEEDYRLLCLHVGLATPVPLDVYIVTQASTDQSEDGIARSYPYPGYNRTAIHLALDAIEVPDFHLCQPTFPPTRWVMFYEQWPSWRVSLWHEAIHQYDDQILHTWDPQNPHGQSWENATACFAAKFGKSTQEIKDVTLGAIAPLNIAPGRATG
jgi:hypothetical protein